MYTIVSSLPARQLVVEQLPSLGVSIVIAETLYKFHSFTLECLAFLATWYAVDWSVQRVSRLLGRPGRD